MDLDLRQSLGELGQRLRQDVATRFASGAETGAVPARADGSKPGVRTGALEAALQSTAIVEVTRTSVGLVLPESVRTRAIVYHSGSAHQPARPFLGISDERRLDAAQTVARAGRDQIVADVNKRVRG